MSDTELVSERQDVSHQEDPEAESKRAHSLTDKGHTYFRERLEYHLNKISKVASEIDIKLQSIVPQTVPGIEQLKLSVKDAYGQYSDLCTDLVEFLSRYNTSESEFEQDSVKLRRDSYQKKVVDFHNELENKICLLSEEQHSLSVSSERHKSSRSSVSRSTRSSSTRSSGSTMLSRQRAKVNGAEAKLRYAQKEAELKREAALLSIDMELLQAEKEAAVADAEYTGMKEVLCDNVENKSEEENKSETLNRYFESITPTSVHVNQVNTQSNVESTDIQHSPVYTHPMSTMNTPPVTQPSIVTTSSVPNDTVSQQFSTPVLNASVSVSNTWTTVVTSPNTATSTWLGNQTSPSYTTPVMSTKPTVFGGQQTTYHTTPVIAPVPELHRRDSTAPGLNEFSNYLLKREILPLRVTEFDDRAETYQAWKISFNMLKSELRTNPREELDLLVKYLGAKSREHALSIRSANLSYPSRAVDMIWRRLDERYGSPVLLEASLKARLEAFPQLMPKDSARLYDLADLLVEIQSRMEDPTYQRSLAYFDSSSGMRPIVTKLPYGLQEKWTSRAASYNARYHVIYPPFTYLVEFVTEMSRIRNNPGFNYQSTTSRTNNNTHATRNEASSAKGREPVIRRDNIRVRKTDVNQSATVKSNTCVLHEAKHSLNQCKTFQRLTLTERKKLLKDYNICFKCCESTQHSYKTCAASVKCDICNSTYHATALHIDVNRNRESTTSTTETTVLNPTQGHGWEASHVSKCTTICGGNFKGRSCAKVCLVKVYPYDKPHLGVNMYALLDDQSTSTLARTEFFDIMNIPKSTMTTFTLTSCSGQQVMTGRQGKGFIVESADGTSRLELPVITECSEIPNERSEIPTPDVTKYHEHLRNIPIPTLNSEAPILLLIGRDLPEAHHIEAQRTGPRGTPFGQKLKLGWVLIGNVCLGTSHPPDEINVLKTSIGKDGRISLFTSCDSNIAIKVDDRSLFHRDRHDNSIGMSIEDKKFLTLLDKEFTKMENGNWSAPLPFKEPRPKLPNNRSVALKRALTLQSNLRRNPEKCEHFTTFMQRIFDSGHAEVAPPIEADNSEVWYLPLFGVYHPKKPNQIRVVFDSSCSHEDLSLNNVLMQGPDLMNRLDGVLLRFRKEPVAVMADIQQMFFCFYVHECHRDYLRFFWHRNNDINQPLMEYRMCVHVFGNSPSPAVANYGLRKCVDRTVNPCDADVQEFVTRNFYVDDGLMSFSSTEQAVDILKRTQETLMEGGNLRLHKIASNSEQVMLQFPVSDLMKSVQPLDLFQDDLPIHHSLGLEWELATDTFTFHTSEVLKPFTKRGLLSTVNGIFDPLGFVSPIVIRGKIIMRDAVNETNGWDDPIPPQTEKAWRSWIEKLINLDEIHIPRCFLRSSFSECSSKSLHIFSDASECAVAACAYVRAENADQEVNIGFIFGKAKVAPKHGHTIPRLELCAAVMATEIGEMLSEELGVSLEDINYYTDSNVVLGYISNEQRRFYMYVSNRVAQVRRSSSPRQWHHVNSEENPADEGTRGLFPEQFSNSQWINGPAFLRQQSSTDTASCEDFPLVQPDSDKELRPEVHTLKTTSKPLSLGSSRFKRFSTWDSLVRAIRTIRLRMRRQAHIQEDLTRREVEVFILKQSQLSDFYKELQALISSKPVPRDSPVLNLNPIRDQQGLLRVGGRVKRGNFNEHEKSPILISGRSCVAKLLIQHHHAKVHHSGRHITEGAIRSSGLWITGGKRLISSHIHHCVTCRRLRGRFAWQKMSDLPQDRLTPSPPFTFVGVDVFGPWTIVTRRTRGGNAGSKRWAVLFTCLYCRAVHIEVISEMSASSFINAMRRFIAVRGKVSEFRSDCGSNFVGAVNELGINQIHVGDPFMKNYLDKNNILWRFNPPHSSHFGGAWERLIGVARRILDGMLLDVRHGQLTDEVLTTFMAEVSAIINSRPLVSLSSDTEMPHVLSPGILLTQKPNEETVHIFQNLDVKDMYRSQWRLVQVMANSFWKRWRSEFLSTIQRRSKWSSETANLKCGDIVLLRDKDYPRIQWPKGIVTKTFPSEDGLIRKLEIRIVKDNKSCVYVRPISEVVPLMIV